MHIVNLRLTQPTFNLSQILTDSGVIGGAFKRRKIAEYHLLRLLSMRLPITTPNNLKTDVIYRMSVNKDFLKENFGFEYGSPIDVTYKINSIEKDITSNGTVLRGRYNATPSIEGQNGLLEAFYLWYTEVYVEKEEGRKLKKLVSL